MPEPKMNENNNPHLSPLARLVTDARPDLTEMMTIADQLSRAGADAAIAGKTAAELFDETMALGEKRANETRRRMVAEMAQKGLPSQNCLNPAWTFESMAPWAQEPENRGRIARAWAFCERFGEHLRLGGMAPGLIIIGATGSGKSHLSGAIAHEIHKRHPGASIIFTTLSALAKAMIERYSIEKREMAPDPYAAAAECDLLIVEDAVSPGVKESDFRNEQLGNLLRDRRNACKSTVVTLNAVLGDLPQRIGAHAYAGLQEMADNIINLGQYGHRKSLAEIAALEEAGSETEIENYLAESCSRQVRSNASEPQANGRAAVNFAARERNAGQEIFRQNANIGQDSPNAWQPAPSAGVSDLSDGYDHDGYSWQESEFSAYQNAYKKQPGDQTSQSPEPYFAHKSAPDLVRVGICCRDDKGRLLADLSHEVWSYDSAMGYAIVRYPIVGAFNPDTGISEYFSNGE